MKIALVRKKYQLIHSATQPSLTAYEYWQVRRSCRRNSALLVGITIRAPFDSWVILQLTLMGVSCFFWHESLWTFQLAYEMGSCCFPHNISVGLHSICDYTCKVSYELWMRTTRWASRFHVQTQRYRPLGFVHFEINITGHHFHMLKGRRLRCQSCFTWKVEAQQDAGFGVHSFSSA